MRFESRINRNIMEFKDERICKKLFGKRELIET